MRKYLCNLRTYYVNFRATSLKYCYLHVLNFYLDNGVMTTPKRRFLSFAFREELDQFITSVNSFHPALKYTWEISETSLPFLDIKVSIRGNVLCTSVHYKPTDSHSYLLYSSSHPSHVKNSIPYSQFLRLRRLCSDDSDFSSKSEEMCQFFEKRGRLSCLCGQSGPSSRPTI